MKTVGKIAGAVVLLLIVALIILRITGVNPNERRAGLWLTGHVVTAPVTDWSFTDKVDTIKVQTNMWLGIPHSVTTQVVTYQERLYLNSRVAPGVAPYPGGKLWNRDVARDPRVRLKIGNDLYDCVLVYVSDPAERDAVVQANIRKYPGWNVPQGSGVNIFRVVYG
jgi:hypothetical protein